MLSKIFMPGYIEQAIDLKVTAIARKNSEVSFALFITSNWSCIDPSSLYDSSTTDLPLVNPTFPFGHKVMIPQTIS